MRRWLPILFVLLAPCLLFPGALPGPRVVSADDHLSVHHAFQQVAGGHVRHPALSDPALQFAGLRARVVEALRSGEAPLWNPDLYGGAPLLADMQSMVGSPVTWLHALVPWPDVAQDLGVWWVLAWTGVGAFLLARALHLARWPSAVAGVGASTGPYVMVWLLHPHAATFAWVPWLLWAVERRSVPAIALTAAGLVGGGHPETAAYGLGMALCWSVARRRGASRTIAGLALGGLISAPLWVPFLEQLERSATLAAHGGNRLAPAQLLDLVWPGWWGHPAAEGYTGSGVWADGVLHPGLGVLVFAALGARPSRGLWMAWAACVGVALVGLPVLNTARLGSVGALLLALAAAHGAARWRHAGPALLVLATAAWARHDDQAGLDPAQHAPEPAPWVDVLRATAAEGRVLGLGWALQPNTGSLVGLRDMRGYDLPVSRDTEALMARFDPVLERPWFQVATVPDLRLLQAWDVRALVAPEPLDAVPSGLTAVAVDAPLAIYAVDPGPGFAHVQGRRATWSRSAGTITIEVPASGRLEVAEAWAPGWTADRPVRAFEGRMTLDVEAGEQVVLRYRPAGWLWGTRLGGLGWLTLIGLVARERRSRR